MPNALIEEAKKMPGPAPIIRLKSAQRHPPDEIKGPCSDDKLRARSLSSRDTIDNNILILNARVRIKHLRLESHPLDRRQEIPEPESIFKGIRQAEIGQRVPCKASGATDVRKIVRQRGPKFSRNVPFRLRGSRQQLRRRKDSLDPGLDPPHLLLRIDHSPLKVATARAEMDRDKPLIAFVIDIGSPRVQGDGREFAQRNVGVGAAASLKSHLDRADLVQAGTVFCGHADDQPELTLAF